MRRVNLHFDKSSWSSFIKFAAVAIFLTGTLPALSTAQQHGQKTFASAEEASNALFIAAQSNDEKALMNILGPDGKRIVSSGDPAEDAESRATFAKKYQELHRLVKEPNGTTTLYIGAENWPTPIPLLNKGDSWLFDTEAGEREILMRRIGRNEISTVHVCQELLTAQKEFHQAQSTGYAQKIISDEGQHNGLYWKADEGQPKSPIGPLVAAAFLDTSSKNQEPAPAPYRGYYFHLLAPSDKSGADSKAAEGFAYVAYPAEYRSSGVMTFMVNQDGIVYEKDLGKKTVAIARHLKQFMPGSGWKMTEEQSEQTASEQKPH